MPVFPTLKRSLCAASLGVLCALPLSAQAPAPKPAPKPAPADTTDTTRAAAPLVVYAVPGGDTLLVLPGGAAVQAIGHEGGWTRVRIEGWTRGGVAAEGSGSPGSPLRTLSLRTLRAEPERFRGQAVEWSAEYVSLQRADSLRTDLERGETYVLARDPGGEAGFIYLVVPPAQIAAFRQFSPLQRFRFLARVRNGRAPQMGNPVLELIELRP